MTIRLIQSITAASLIAAFAGAQEEHEHEVVIETRAAQDPVKAGKSKANAEHGAALHKKLMALIDKLSSDELSSKQRKKTKAALLEVVEALKAHVGAAKKADGYHTWRFGSPAEVHEHEVHVLEAPKHSGREVVRWVAKDPHVKHEAKELEKLKDLEVEYRVKATPNVTVDIVGEHAHEHEDVVLELQKALERSKGEPQGGVVMRKKAADMAKRAKELRRRVVEVAPEKGHGGIAVIQGDGEGHHFEFDMEDFKKRVATAKFGEFAEAPKVVETTDGQRFEVYQGPKKAKKKGGDVFFGDVAKAPKVVETEDGRAIYFLDRNGKESGKAKVTYGWTTDKGDVRFVAPKVTSGKNGWTYLLQKAEEGAEKGDVSKFAWRTAKSDGKGGFTFVTPKGNKKVMGFGGAPAKGGTWVFETEEDEDEEVHEHGDRRGNVFFGRVADHDEDDDDDEELLELIEEMREEMAELRAMMQEIRAHIRGAGAGATRARARFREAPAATPTRARRLRYVRDREEERETR